MSLGLPWTPYRFAPGSYHVMDCWARVVASGMTQEQASYISRTANNYYPIRNALQAIAERLNDEEIGEAEGNHIQKWEEMHGTAVQVLEDAARPLRISGEDY